MDRPPPVPQLLLASSLVAPAVADLAPRRIVLVPTAANPLPDRDDVVDAVRRQLVGEHRVVVVADPEAGDDLAAADLEPGDLLAVGGGDPFHLLDVLRSTGADRVIRDGLDRGVHYLGVSAGAIVAGPSLVPLVGVSPFTPPAGLDLDGLGLAPVVVLPHDERPGRHDRHLRAAERHGRRWDLVPLLDHELVVVDGGHLRVVDLREGAPLGDRRPPTDPN